MAEVSDERVHTVTQQDAALPRRVAETHKGDYGRVLIIGGSVGYTGAPSLAARAAVRCGSGLVFLGVPEPIYQISAVKNDEAMVFPLPSDDGAHISIKALDDIMERLGRMDACLIGPGLGLTADTRQLVLELLARSGVPLIIDADGITAAAAHIDRLRRAVCPVVLTPHEGEFRRLLPSAGAGDAAAEARDFAMVHNVVLVRKGHRTVTAFPDGEVFRNTTGNPGMAKGGSGDVLAGMILSFVGQGFPLKKAVPAAVYLHGRAGDICAAKFGEYALTPSDMIEAFKEIVR